jgi:DNA-binding NarL/FixJ family response regulator
MHAPIEILVVEPHRGMRKSLCSLLAVGGDLRVVAESADVLSALRDAARLHADVAIVDNRAAALGGGSAAKAIGALAKRLPVVVIGMGEPAAYSRLYLEAGASGYWCKTSDFHELTKIVRDAAAARRQAA